MKWKGTDEDTQFTDDVLDEDYDEEDYPVWEKQQKSSLAASLSKKIPLILIAAGMMVVLIVVFMSMRGGGETIDMSRIDSLEKRLADLEARLFKMEGTGFQTEGVEERSRAVDALQDKVLQLETDVTSRMDQLSTRLAKLAKKPPAPVAATPVAKKKPAAQPGASQPVYHQVRSGDTLFGISRRYGISVAEIRELNNLSSSKVIQPGQKLIVKSSQTQ